MTPKFDRKWLGRVFLGAGADTPFCYAEVRAYWGEPPVFGDNSLVIDNTVGIRALDMGSPASTKPERYPRMLRVYPWPRNFGGHPANNLYFDFGNGLEVEAKLLDQPSPSDILIVPEKPWEKMAADTTTDSETDISVPVFRVAEGRLTLSIDMTIKANAALAVALKFDKKNSTILGGLKIDLKSGKYFEIELVPDGIEFLGSLADFTRNTSGTTMDGRFRLERQADGKDRRNILRLVGAGKSGAAELDALEGRIAAILAILGPKGAPAQIRFDKRPAAPPLIWPMVVTGKVCSLDSSGCQQNHFRVEIDPSATDLRMSTSSRFPGEPAALATINQARMTLLRQAPDKFTIEARSGRRNGNSTISMAYTPAEPAWDSNITGLNKAIPVTVPLSAHLDRLLGIYRAAGALPVEATEVPYLFLAVDQGWLQLAVPEAQKAAGEPPKQEGGSTITGRIVASHGSGNRLRSVTIEQAAGLKLTLAFTQGDNGFEPVGATLEAWTPQMRFAGFLFAAETSPTGQEALPTLRGGPAATRDLPMISPRNGPGIEAEFEWIITTDADNKAIDHWNLKISDVTADHAGAVEATALDGLTGQHLAWLPPSHNPFITNYPITRGLPSSTEPSVSRGLVPWRVGQKKLLTLVMEVDGADAPKVSGDLTWALPYPEPKALENKSFLPDTLILPTLAGIELLPPRIYDPQKALRAALRYDLPILDELFAWSDPPPPKNAKPDVTSENRGPEERAPTAVEPDRLMQVWDKSRKRMALTRTQAAFATPWLETGGKPAPIKIDNLVEPLTWNSKSFVVTLDEPYGKFELDGVLYSLKEAVEGRVLTFKIAGSTIAPPGEDETAEIQIEGFAANIYNHSNYLWDSRGFGMGAAQSMLDHAAVRAIKITPLVPKDTSETHLLSMHSALEIAVSGDASKGFRTPLNFLVRDLPVKKNGEGYAFDGKTNPIENSPGADGSAFDPDELPRSLHEWRFFASLPKAGSELDDRRQQFYLRYGPFAFTPLRLLEAKFNLTGAMTKLTIVGRAALAPLVPNLEADSPAHRQPFGPDEVYERGDLFKLALTPEGETWKAEWQGLSYEGEKLVDRDNVVRVETTLSDRWAGKTEVPAQIDINLKSYAEGEKKLPAKMRARLFGCDWSLDLEGAIADDLLTLTPAQSATKTGVVQGLAVHFKDVKIKLFLKAGSENPRIDYQPILKLGVDDKTSLLEISPEQLDWLDLKLTPAPPESGNDKLHLTVDHESGRVTADCAILAPKGLSPLFVLKASNALAVRALLAGYPEAKGGVKSDLEPITLTTAWMRVDGREATEPNLAIEHVFSTSVGRASSTLHRLYLTGKHEVKSLIRWPSAGLSLAAGGGAINDLFNPKSSIKPDGVGKPTTFSHDISIDAAEQDLLRHTVTVHFNRHEIEAQLLAAGEKKLILRKSVQLLVTASHELREKGDDKSNGVLRLSWSSLDTVNLTTPQRWIEEASELAFAPRYELGKYRATKLADTKEKDGMLKLRHAVSGFFDDLLIGWLEKGGGDEAVVVTGGAIMHFPWEDRAFVAVIPWIDSDAAAALRLGDLTLQSKPGRWRVALADFWGGSALQQSGALATTPLKLRIASVDIGNTLGVTASTPSLPMEQAFFERLDQNGKVVAMEGDEDELLAAPFFVRSIFAIYNLLQTIASEKSAASQVAGTLFGNLSSVPASRLRVVVSDPGIPGTPAVETFVPADLIVLSADRKSETESYRMIERTGADQLFESASSEIRDLALNEDRQAGVAIRMVRLREGPVMHLVPLESSGLSFSETFSGELLRKGTDLSPSAALGWPSARGVNGISALAPVLGDEFPIMSSNAGFSARTQSFGWPARASAHKKESDDAQDRDGYYLSFSSHVIYDRGQLLGFDGPAARHLLVSPVRRRLPVEVAQAVALQSEDEQPTDNAGRLKAVLPPVVTRTTIGRRPGVFEVLSASVIIPDIATAFDSDRPQFGQPGNSSPVASHQLRNPRSPVLPADDIEDLTKPITPTALALRRRTYLSLGDFVDVEADEEGERYRRLKPFGQFSGNADVFRISQAANEWRVVVSLANEEPIGSAWGGTLEFELKAVSSNGGTIDQLGAVLWPGEKLPSVRLEIGGKTFDGLKVSLLPEDKDAIQRTIRATASTSLAEIRALLVAANADTPMRVVIEFDPDPVDSVKLQTGPKKYVSVPLQLAPGDRRVMPVLSQTIAFGDPSYDRQLASLAQQDLQRIDDKPHLLVCDRKEYNTWSVLYLAAGVLGADGSFDGAQAGSFSVRFSRLPVPGSDADQQPQPLVIAGQPSENSQYKIEWCSAYEVPLSRLVANNATARSRPALLPGERLEIATTFVSNGKTTIFRLIAAIVAGDVIAPAPSVFTVLEAAGDGVTVPLHAAAPLPQRVEFPDLLNDLANGHVRRQGLFIWRSSRPKAEKKTGREFELLKFDRSGGAQLPG
ncbi:hypothetical protein IHQ71_22855 [Rhizobium sp. TH2]|uniref:hypothetical protein n=1 Tax=Rhizobium sp. TH2 TaxID=2775403 RepID=UPI0021584022|nr:hypothetical protein [Rhizobium sp. TH2]UVC07983.1 hypothetical protein IHQ71_22855 [Rhizobium sp. TH2]